MNSCSSANARNALLSVLDRVPDSDLAAAAIGKTEALGELRAATVELCAAIDATNRNEAILDTIEDADENRAYQESTWWPSRSRRERASKAFAELAVRCKVGVVVLGGRLFATFRAAASECEEPVQGCYTIALDRVVVLD